jgi:hypothetical protein
MTESSTYFSKLGEANFAEWSHNMKAYLMQKKVWLIVSGDDVRPSSGTADLRDWLKDQQAAAGFIYLGLEKAQKTQVQQYLDDPKKMWEVLVSIHVHKRPATRFNAYNALLSIKKEENESLPSLTARVEKAMHDIKNTRPDSFSIEELDGDLMCMALTRALPSQYASFISSLVLLPKFDFPTLKEAFIMQEENDKGHQDSVSASAHFTSVASRTSKQSKQPSTRPVCDFCNMKGHTQDKCYQFRDMKKLAQQNVVQRSQQRS